jgi:RPA family protein
LKRRNPYRRIRIESLTRSELLKDQEDRWRLVTPSGKNLFRVWIMGVVTQKYSGENNYIGLMVEDGSAGIIAKSWDGKLDSYNQWDKVELLGQIQISEKDDEIDVFLNPELIHSISDDNWFLVHRLKIIQQLNEANMNVEMKNAKISGVDLGIVSIDDLKTKLIDTVRNLDSGKGVSYDQIVKMYPNIDEEQIDSAITDLLESGEFFEPRAGIYSSAIDS